MRFACDEIVAKRQRRWSVERVRNIWRPIRERFPWLSPSLDGNPVLWREWHRSRPSRWMVLIVGAFAVMSLACSAATMILSTPATNAWVNGLQVSIGLLLLSAYGGDVAGRGASARKHGLDPEHAAFDPRDRDGEMARSIPGGAAPGDLAGDWLSGVVRFTSTG